MLIPTTLMMIVVFGISRLMPVNYSSKLSCVLYVAVNAIVGAIIYFFVSFKTGIIEKVFGKESVNRILKKLTFGKVSI